MTSIHELIQRLTLSQNTKINSAYKVAISLLLCSFLFNNSVYAQPTADSAKYISPSQDIISVYFSEPVTLSDLTGWSIDVGGTIHTQGPAPAGMVLAGITGNRVDISLLFSFPKTNIEYNDVIAGVSIDYDGSGDLRQSAAPNNAVIPFSNLPAINDIIITCNMLSSVQSIGTAASSGPCQPVNIQLYIEWNWLPIARNSIHFSDQIQARVFWRNVADTRVSYPMIESGVGSGKYTVVTAAFIYTEENVCTWNPTVYPIFISSGGDPEQPDLLCSGGVNQQDYIIPAYRLDNEQLDGILSVVPTLGSDPTLFCVGEDIPGFVFSDATTFNCNINVEPDRPNEGQRWMKFVYGTHSTAGIPNVWIDVHGTPVFVTDANGDPITEPFTVDPATGAVVPPYNTNSNFFESDIFIIPEPCTAPIASTYPIHHTGNYVTDEEDDIFGVTLQNWGPCNQWDPVFPATPIEIYNELRLVPAPAPPTVPSPDECFGSVSPSITASGGTGVIDWYDDPNQTSNVYTGPTYTHGENAVGTYSWWLTETRVTTGPVACTSDTVRSTLTIHPLPEIDKPVSDDEICEADVASITVDNTQIGVEYTLRLNSNNSIIDGPTDGNGGTITFTLSPTATSTYNVLARYKTGPLCDAELTDISTVTVNDLAIITVQSPDRTICENENTTFLVNASGPGLSYRWQVNPNTGSWSSLSNGGVYSGVTTNTLTITSATAAMDNYQYRIRIISTGPCGMWSPPRNLNVNPIPADKNTWALDEYLCRDESTTIRIENADNNVDYTIVRSPQPATSTLTGGGGDLDFPTGPITSFTGVTAFTYTITAESANGCTLELTDHPVIYGNDRVQINAISHNDICEYENIDLPNAPSQEGSIGNPGFEWAWTGTSIAGTITDRNPAPFLPSTTGTHNINLLVTDANFRDNVSNDNTVCTATRNLSFEVNLQPVDRNVPDPALICYNTSANITIESSENGIDYLLYTMGGTFVGTTTGNGGDRTISTGALTITTQYYVIARNTNFATNCERRLTDEPTVTVNPRFQLAQLQEDASICLNTDYDFNVQMTGGVSPYDLVFSTTPGGNTPLNNYVSGTDINTGNLLVDTDYALVSVVDDEGCPAESLGTPITITVGAVYVSVTITAGTDICTGEDAEIRIVSVGGAPPYTYEITGDNAPAGEFDVYAADTTITIAGLAVGIHSYNLITARDVCGNNAGSILNTPDGLEVFEIPVITAVNNADPICNGDDTDIDLSSTVNGTIYSWTIIAGAGAPWVGGNAPSAGNFTEAGAGYTIAQTLQHSSVSPVTVTYQITSAGPGATACAGNTETVSVEVAPTAVVNSASSLILCTNTAFSYTITSSTPGATFLWNRAAVVGISNGALLNQASNPISETLINTTSGSLDVDYVITPSILGCPGTPFTFTVTVNPTPAINNLTATICDDGSFAVTPADGGDGIVPAGTSYSWGIPVVTGGLTGGVAAAGQVNISGTLSNPTNTVQTATYTVTPLSGTCTGITFDVTVTVNPTPAISNLSETICDDGSFTTTPVNIADGIVPAGTTYSWGAPTVTGGITGGAAGAIQANIFGTLSNPTNSVQTATYTITPVSGTCTGSTFTIIVTVNPTPAINDMSATTCGGSGFTVSPVNGVNGIVPAGTTYSWGIPVVTGGLTGGVAAAGQANISGTLVNPTNTAQTATYTVTPISGACTGTDFTVTITVNPTPAINNLIATICDDGTFTTTPADGADGIVPAGISYSWNAPTVTGGLTGGVAASGQANISGTLNNPTSSTQTATYTVTPLAGTCAGATFDVTVTVNPTPILSSTLTPADLCSNSLFNYVPTSNTAGTTFNWTRASIAGITPAGPTAGTDNPGETLQNITSATIPVTYQYTLAANGCSNVQDVIVNIKPEPVITPNQIATECSGNALNYEIQLDNFSYPNVTFTWPLPTLNPIDPGFSGGSARAAASANNIGDTYANTTGLLGEATYVVTPYYDGCAGTPVDVVVQIGAEPVLDPNLDDEACSQVAIGLTLQEAPGSIVPDRYEITNVNIDPGLVPDALNNDAPIDGVLADYLSNNNYANRTGVDQDVVFTVIPKFGASCVGDPVDITITIHPEPVILPGQSPLVCSKEPINYEVLLLPANNPAGTTFDWPVPVMSDFSGQGTAGAGVAADPAGTIHLTDAIQNYSGGNITATYTITPTSALLCAGVPTDVIVTIQPQPVTTPIVGDDQVCTDVINILYQVDSHPGSTYAWTVPPQVGTTTFDFNTNIIIVTAAAVAGTGDITVLETNSLGCVGDVVSLTVDVSAPVAPENIVGDPVVCAQSTHIYNVTDRVGSVYSWTIPGGAAFIGDPSASSITLILGNNGGTVSVIETTAAGCETTHNPFAVTVNPLPTATISNGGSVCQGNDQPLQVSFTGTGPWTFTHAYNGVDQAPIATSDNPYTLDVNLAGSYTITSVTDANTCTGTGSGTAVVGVYPTPTGEITGTTDICPGESTVITMSFTGTAPFDFTYTDGITPVTITNHPSVVFTATVSPAVSTTYTLTALSDGNGCTGTVSGAADITLNVPAVINAIGTDPLCTGDFNGETDLQVLSGTPAYSFQWTGPNGYTANTEDITLLEDGIYDVTVTDGNGCETSTSVTLTDPALLTVSAAVSSDYNGTDISCNGALDGELTATPAGGTGAYSYEWFEDAGLTISTGQTAAIATTLAAGTYYIQLTDINLCTTTAFATLIEPVALAVTVNVSSSYNGEDISCNTATDGQATALPTGGTGVYTYEWFTDAGLTTSTGITTQVANGLGAGDYWVRILDVNSCEIVGTVSLTAPAPVTAVASVSSNYNGSDISCNGVSDGSALVMPAGGTGAYTYAWYDDAALTSPIGQTTQTATNLSAGQYWVEVTDVNSCTGTATVTLTEPVVLSTTVAVSSNYSGADISCFGASDGAITATPAGGTGAYSYIWYSNAAMTISIGQTTATAVNLSAGTYYVRILDVNGCEISGNATLTDPPALTLNITTDSNFNGMAISCNGELDGVVTANVGGGTGIYTYTWYDDAALTSPIGQTTVTASGLGAGTYWVEVTDENLCAISGNVTLTEPNIVTVSAIVSSDYNGSDISCFGAADGEVTATPAGGTGVFSYAWYDDAGLTSPIGQTTQTATGLVAGTYWVEVSDVNGCSESTSITLTDPVVLSVTTAVVSDYFGEDISCNGATDGEVSATPAGGTGAYSYAWYNDAALTSPIGQTNFIATGLGAGTYWIEVTDLNGCTASVSVTLTDPPVLSVVVAVSSNFNGSDISCNGANDGAITATPAGGTGAYSYIWYSNAAMTITIGQTTATAVNLTAGTYYVQVFDDNKCEATGSATLTDPPALTLNITTDSNFAGSDISCNGALDGQVTANVGGGTGVYTYTWYDDAALTSPIGQTTATASGLGAGTYWVEVLDENLCAISGSVTLTEPAIVTVSAIVSSNYNGSDISCFGAADGEVTATPTGGTGAFTYAWYDDALLTSPIGQTTQTATGLVAGTYWVEVSDVNGCSESTSVTLTDPVVLSVSAAVTSDYNGEDVSCNTATDGVVEASVAGGTGFYTYAWYDDALLTSPIGQTNYIATGLGAGTYWVEVTDQNGCTESASVTVTEPVALSVVVAVSSNYNGADISCAGAFDGAITATPAGGTGVYSYIWYSNAAMTISIGQNTATAINLNAGTYYVRIIDVNGCETSGSATLSDPPALTLNISTDSNFAGSDISCNGALDGQVTANVGGGTGVYAYAWYDDAALTSPIGQTAVTATGLGAGTYWVEVTDENLCTISGSVILTEPDVVTVSAAVSSNHNGSAISCFGAADGEVTATPAGGTGAYTYVWYDDALLTSPIGQTTQTATGLVAGTYWVEVSDVNGCSESTSVTLTDPAILSVTAGVSSDYNGEDISCNGLADGAVLATPTGGTGAYTYVWYDDVLLTSPIGQTTQTASNLAAGTYWVEVTDLNGCTESTSVTVTEPAVLSLALSITSNYNGEDISCNGAADGVVDATVSGGTGTYFYSWFTDPLYTVPLGQFTATAINLIAGDYYLRVTDLNGCEITANITLTEPVALNATETARTDVSCFGGADGSMTVEATAGTGVAPYQYSMNGGATWQASGTFNALPAGSYIVQVEDANGCSFPVTVTISQPTPLTASTISTNNVSCNGLSDGDVNIEATVGSGTAPYQYSIDGGTNWQATGVFAGLSAGPYTVTVEDALGCSIDIPVSITEPPVLELNPTADILLDCFGDADGTGAFYALGGTLPYTFSEVVNTSGATLAPPGFNSQSIFGAGAGVVTIRVTDGNTCQVDATITFTQPAALNPGTIEADQVVCYGDDPDLITEDVAATGGPAGGYIYQWQMANNIAGPYINIPLATAIDYDPPAGITSTTFYRREVQAGICNPEYSDTVEVFVNPLPSGLLTGGEAICPGGSSILNVEMTTGLGPFEIDIDNHGVVTNYNSDDDIIVSPVVTTTYRLLRITDSNLCQVVAPSGYLNGSATVTLLEPPAISLEPENDTICEFGTANFTVSATGAGLSYQWYESRSGGPFNPLADTGSYIGTLSSNMNIFNVNRSYDTYEYRVVVSGTCAPLAPSVDVELTVHTAPEILAQPESINVCENAPAGFGIDAQGTGITYQWMVNDGMGYDPIDFANTDYTGADSDTLTLLSAQLGQTGDRYMIRVSGTCAPVATSEEVTMLVEPNPTITTQPVSDAICENGATVFTAGASGPAGMVYQWYVDRNDGFGFVALVDDGIHFGSDTEQLSISGATVGMNAWRYQFEVSTACMPVLSDIVTLTVWDNPVPSITPVGVYPFYPLICGGDVLTLDGSPVGGSGTYDTHQWSGAVGPLSATNTQIVDFESIVKGQYALAYTVTDNRGCVGSDVVTIENERPTAQFTSDAVPSCGYVDVEFTNTSSAEATSFLWDFDDGTTSPDRDVTHGFDNISATGEVAYYNISMTAISDHDCRDIAQSVITIYPKVDATFDADPIEGCHPLNVTFITAPGAGNYQWDFGDGTTVPSGAYVISHLYENYTTAAVVHTAELTTTSYYGCQDTKTVDITVEPIPAPNFTAAPMVQTYPDATVSFTNTTSDGPWTYSWNFGDGNTSTQEDPIHTYADPGTYMVTFYVNNGDCIDSAGTSVVIHPRVPIAAFAEPPGGCSPLEIQFINQSQWATSYLWDFGDGYVSTKENPSHTYYDPGEMTVRLQVNGPGGSAYASWTLNIYETPNIAFNYAPDSVFVKDKPVRFFNLTSGATDYKWDFDDYYEDGSAAPLNFSGAYDTTHIYFTEGLKNVKLVAWNEHCIDSLILPAVKVIPAGDVQFPTVFRPNPQGPSGGFVDPNDPNLDPSIANSIFFPGVNKQVEEYHLYIYNRWGELIFQSHDINIGWDGYIRGTLAAQGVYLWKVTLVYKNGSPDSMAGDITLLWKKAQ